MVHPKLQPLKRVIDKHDTWAGRAFDLFILALIAVAIVCFSIDTLDNLSPTARWWLRTIELTTIVVFTIEYLLRILVADHKLKFIFSFLGMVDLLAIVPFYLTLGVDLRMLRALRFLRVFSALKIVRYNRAMQRLSHAFQIAREEIMLFLLSALLLIYFSAVGIYYFENPAQPEVFSSVFDCLWWSVITLATVGYGDMYPITVGGRMFTFLILMVGLGIFSVPAGLVASAMVTAREMERERDEAAASRIHPTIGPTHDR